MKIVPNGAAGADAADPDRFTGPVWRTQFLPRARPDGLTAHRFMYAPGARSHWHVHTAEQALVVTEGRGLVQWEGLEHARPVGPGDWVHVEPGVPHWHGATPDNVFVHLAVTAGGDTEWGAEVPDAAYQASLPPPDGPQ